MMMKISIIKLLIILLIIFSLGSCNDAIFYKITVEPPLVDPLIGGSPTNFVEYNNKLYVASGRKIFSYGKNEESGNNEWSEWIILDSFVLNLAVAGDSFYALYLSSNSGKIRRYYNGGNSSEEVNLSGNVQSIHALDNFLFVSVRNSNNNIYKFYYKEEGAADFNEISLEKTNSGPLDCMIKGVAFDITHYYLCTDYGIFCIDKSVPDFSSYSILAENYSLTGITNLNSDCVAAIAKNGRLCEISSAVISKEVSFGDSHYATGALAVWRNEGTPTLLLVGRGEEYYSSTSSYSNGYLEIALDTTGRILDGAAFIEPGKTQPTSIDDYDRYSPSLGKKLIYYIIQTPASIDENMTMFASTSKSGLWSYRDHGEGITWNAEQ